MRRSTAFPVKQTRCIVVGYDGSTAACEALRHAASKAQNARLVVVHVYGPSVVIRDDDSPFFGEQRMYRQALLAELADKHARELEGIDYRIEVVRGNPAATLANVARSWDADEIVVGSSGLSRASAIGGVSGQLAQIADRPVVLVPSSHLDTRIESEPVRLTHHLPKRGRSMRYGSAS
jgi:nucleotide-binding universal stress UspA family protein